MTDLRAAANLALKETIMPDDAASDVSPHREGTGLLAAWLRQKADPAGAAGRAKQWETQNADAIAAYNERIEREGCFGEEWRTW